MIEIEYVWHLEMIRIGQSQHSKTTAGTQIYTLL